MQKLLNEILALENKTGIIDAIYNNIDDLLLDEKFEEVDLFLDLAKDQIKDLSYALSLLTITFYAKKSLKNRKEYFDSSFKECLKSHSKEETKNIFRGLE